MKKRSLVAILAIALCALLVACGGGNKTTETTQAQAPTTPTELSSGLRVAGLKGPTTMGIVKLMEDNGQNSYEILGTPEEAAAKITKGEVDIALLPSNVAANIYNKGVQVKMAGINTLGVLYMVETGDSIQSVADLKGKTIVTTGKGATPEYILNYILTQNGIDPQKDVTIEYKGEATEVANLLSTGEDTIALLPQPYVTTVQSKNNKVRVALDMNEEWKKVNPNSEIVTGVILVRDEVLTNNKENFDRFMQEYAYSVSWVNSNPQEAGVLIEGAGIAPAAVAAKAIPECNIVLIQGQDMATKTNGYLQVLFDQNAKSVGGKMPDDNFYLK